MVAIGRAALRQRVHNQGDSKHDQRDGEVRRRR